MICTASVTLLEVTVEIFPEADAFIPVPTKSICVIEPEFLVEFPHL